MCWVFSEESRAQQLGHTLLEYWLPLIDVKSLETTLSSTTAQCSHTGPQHTVPEQQHPDTDRHPADTEPHLTDAEQQQTDIVQHHSDSEQDHADAENWQRGDTERQQQKAMERDHEITDTDKMTSEMAYPDTDTQLLVELAHNSAFIHTLMTVLAARQEIAAIAANVAEHLAGMLCEEVPDKSASASTSTVSVVLDTCTTLFQQLFLQDSLPQDYQVINMLKVMIILMRGSGSNTCDAFNVKSVYHVVKFVGSQEEDTQSESIKWCVEYLLRYTDDRIVADCLCIGPILVQNKGFMVKLERILSGSCHTEVDSVMRLVSWLAATARPEGEVPYQIHVSHIFLLDVVTTGDGATPAGGLSLLSAALSVPPSTQGPVVFSRDRLIQDTPLFTARDVRTLYFHLQQLVCQDCQVVFNCALECIYKLYKYAAAVHKALASQLSSQPWNKLWLEAVLHASWDLGCLSQEMLQLLQMLSDFPTCQELIAVSGETFLHAVLKSPLQEHEAQRVTHILSKCMLVKTVKPHLLQQVENHLGQPVH
ncbi:uncharacterized protein [Haliotis cracherodii]|uniref:uncharacterized protein n=1 Tax=Haliotis cracherodii TaxID=6455 RepID=UPI0039EB8BD4